MGLTPASLLLSGQCSLSSAHGHPASSHRRAFECVVPFAWTSVLLFQRKAQAPPLHSACLMPAPTRSRGSLSSPFITLTINTESFVNVFPSLDSSEVQGQGPCLCCSKFYWALRLAWSRCFIHIIRWREEPQSNPVCPAPRKLARLCTSMSQVRHSVAHLLRRPTHGFHLTKSKS